MTSLMYLLSRFRIIDYRGCFQIGKMCSESDSCLLPHTGQLYGLEKFWAFLKYSKAKTMEIDPKLQEYLSKFKRLEDFRIDVSGMCSVECVCYS